MSATVAPQTTDRSDFRTVITGGTKLGLITAAAVVLYLLASKHLPGTGGVRSGVETLVVLAAGVTAAFLPGLWCAARNAEGIVRAHRGRLLVRSEEGVGSTFTVLLPLSSRGDTRPAVSAAVGLR